MAAVSLDSHLARSCLVFETIQTYLGWRKDRQGVVLGSCMMIASAVTEAGEEESETQARVH